jgi:DNA-binding phage protein
MVNLPAVVGEKSSRVDLKIVHGALYIAMHATRFETYLRSRGIKPAHLARESGYSRQHLLRIRKGRMEPTRRCIAAIVGATRRLAQEPVRAADLFDLNEEG